MKIHVKMTSSASREASPPYRGAPHLLVSGACPSCGAVEDGHFKAIGYAPEQVTDHDTITAPALALCCQARVGTVVVTVSTIFGIEEDERILSGMARVY